MASSPKIRALRRSLGLCALCGDPLPERKAGERYFVNCPVCREKMRVYSQDYRAGILRSQVKEPARSQAPERAPAPKAAPAPRSAERCRGCVWATFAGPGLYVCAFPACINA